MELVPKGMQGFGAAVQEAYPLLLAMSNGLRSGNGVFSQAGTGLAAMMQMQEREEQKKLDAEDRAWKLQERGWKSQDREQAAKDRAQAAKDRQTAFGNVEGFFGSMMGGQDAPSGTAQPAARKDISQGIIETAQTLGMHPVDLATIISYETAGTFDPTKRGPTTQWGQHRGLIQFGEPQAKQFGVDWQNPVGSQLGANGAIARYFVENGWRPGMGLKDAYSIVNAGAPGRYNASDANNGGAPGTVADKVETQMGGHRRKALALVGEHGAAAPQGFLPQGSQPTQRKPQFDPGRLAQIVMSDNIPSAVKQMALNRAFPSNEQAQWQRFDGPDGGVHAFNPVTLETVQIMAGNGGGDTEADREIARLESVGIPRDVAIKIKEGVYKEVTDPTTRETIIIDLGTKQPVMTVGQDQQPPTGGGQFNPPALPAPQSPDLTFGESFGAAENSFGLGGIGRGAANTLADVTGFNMPFPEVSAAQSDFSVLRESMTNEISSAYDGRVPAFLLKNIQELTPKTGNLREGPGKAQDKLRALGRSLQSELSVVDKSMRRRLSPTDREAYMKRKQALESSLAKIKQALGGFGSDVTIRPEVADRLKAYE